MTDMAELTPVKSEITKVASLTSDSFGERWKIKVKVKSKMEKFKSEDDGEYFKVVLEDESGQIDATALGSQNVLRFFDKLEEEKVYFISDGKLTNVDENSSNEGHPCQIHIESGTVVTCVSTENLPSSPFTPLKKLIQIDKTFVDVVGIVTGVWKLEMKYTQYRSINITDENGFDVNVALWGKLATDFDVKSIASVVCLKNLRVKKENGEIELQSTPTTDIDYKPSDHESVVLREILGIAEDINDDPEHFFDEMNSEEEAGHCSKCQKRRGSNSPCGNSACKRRRRDSGTSSGRGKSNRNNLTNGAICRRRGSRNGQGGRGRKSKLKRTNSRGGERKRQGSGSCRHRRSRKSNVSTGSDNVDTESDESEDLEEGRKRLPVRHCKSKYSDFKENMSTSTSSSSSDEDDYSDDETEEDEDKDSKKNNVKKNAKKGKPTKRRLLEDLSDENNDRAKTSSGRVTRLRNKSSADSAKKKSQNHDDGASSSKQPITVISIETDDDSDVDDGENIKPVSSSKKAKRIELSDSDTDATVTYLSPKHPQSTPDSPGKQEPCHADDDDKSIDDKDKFTDDDDDKNTGDDEDNNDGKDVSDWTKKKFKRIKTDGTSSQETEKSVDPGEEKAVDIEEDDDEGSDSSSSSSSGSSSSSSDTHSYHSETRNKDDLCPEEGQEDDRAFIEALRAIQEDDDGTLRLLRHYILWFTMKAGGEKCTGEDFQETVDSKTKLESRLEVVMNICQSQAWNEKFRADIKTYPKFVKGAKHGDFAGGDMRNLGNCEVCNRENHPWSVIVTLEGVPYNRDTYEPLDEDSLEFAPPQYYMGCFCHPRTRLFHKLYHFGYSMYQKCKEMLDDLEDNEKRIDIVATDKLLLNKMYTKLKKWMKEAENDYTEDGQRANSKWKREYNGDSYF